MSGDARWSTFVGSAACAPDISETRSDTSKSRIIMPLPPSGLAALAFIFSMQSDRGKNHRGTLECHIDPVFIWLFPHDEACLLRARRRRAGHSSRVTDARMD